MISVRLNRGRHIDEVTIPTPLLESSSSQKPVPVTSIPISEEVNDVSPIKSLFCNMNLDETEYDLPLPRRRSKNSEFLDLDDEIDDGGWLMMTTATNPPLRSPEHTLDQPSQERLGLGGGSVS